MPLGSSYGPASTSSVLRQANLIDDRSRPASIGRRTQSRWIRPADSTALPSAIAVADRPYCLTGDRFQPDHRGHCAQLPFAATAGSTVLPCPFVAVPELPHPI